MSHLGHTSDVTLTSHLGHTWVTLGQVGVTVGGHRWSKIFKKMVIPGVQYGSCAASEQHLLSTTIGNAKARADIDNGEWREATKLKAPAGELQTDAMAYQMYRLMNYPDSVRGRFEFRAEELSLWTTVGPKSEVDCSLRPLPPPRHFWEQKGQGSDVQLGQHVLPKAQVHWHGNHAHLEPSRC